VIVVVGSRHDPVAASLVEAWPAAALCSAEDLTRPGWVWCTEARARSCWVVDGSVVDDEEVTGVFVRRSAVYPEELARTHPADRDYLAAEAHAFLVFVLSRTGATVVNRSPAGWLGDEALRRDEWMPVASAAGMAVTPVRLASGGVRRRRLARIVVEVVGDQAFGDASAGAKRRATVLAGALELVWATVAFDGRLRLLGVTSADPPGGEAVEALGRLLGRRS
jgi:hypothetical protein